MKSLINTGIYKLRQDQGGNVSFNTIFGEHITALRHTEILEQFQYNINTNTLTTAVANGGTVTQADSMAVLTSSTATNGSANLASKQSLRYRPGHEGYVFFTAMWPNGGVAGAKQYIGLLDANDGYFLGYNGTNFVVGRRDATTDYTTSDFNEDQEFTAKFDNTKLNIFMITYGWLGVAPIQFWWMNEKGQYILIHKMKTPNVLTKPSISQPAVPVSMNITKTSGATSIIMKSSSWHAGISHDGDVKGDRWFSGTISKTGVTTEAVIVSFQNLTTFQGRANKVKVVGKLFGMSADSTKNSIIKIYKNLAIGGTPSWSNVDATNSVMQIDTAGTVTPSASALEFSFPMAKNEAKEIDVSTFEIFLLPGETSTITGQGAQSTDFTFTARWAEGF